MPIFAPTPLFEEILLASHDFSIAKSVKSHELQSYPFHNSVQEISPCIVYPLNIYNKDMDVGELRHAHK
jgi:hypothetical protein